MELPEDGICLCFLSTENKAVQIDRALFLHKTEAGPSRFYHRNIQEPNSRGSSFLFLILRGFQENIQEKATSESDTLKQSHKGHHHINRNLYSVL